MVSYTQISLALVCMLFTLGTAAPRLEKKLPVMPKIPLPKIIEGKDVPKRNTSHHHPYLVSVQFKSDNGYTHTCGGAILDQWTVITAAHCFDGHSDELQYRIVAGRHDLSMPDVAREQISKFSSDAIEEHENFDDFHFDNDIALINLEQPLNYTSFVRAIRLVNSDRPYKKMNAIIVGWGKSLKNAKRLEDAEPMTPLLQEAYVNIYSDEQCIHQWGDDYHPENMICAAGEKGNDVSDKVADACQGDSGGPLVSKDVIRKRRYLVGLVSWGYECGVQQYPGLYTRVETYLSWIEEKRRHMKLNRQAEGSF